MVSFQHIPPRLEHSIFALTVLVATIFLSGQASFAQSITPKSDQAVDDMLAIMHVIDVSGFDIHDHTARRAAIAHAHQKPTMLDEKNLNGAWLFSEIHNPSDTTNVWRLVTEILAPGDFTGFMSTDNTVEQIIHAKYNGSNNILEVSQGPVIVSDPVVVPPYGRVELWLHIENGRFSESYPVRLVPDAIQRAAAENDIRWHAFYAGAAGLLVLYFLIFSWLLKSRASAYYVCFFSTLVLLNFHSYGLLSNTLDRFTALHFAVYPFLHIAVFVFYSLFAVTFLSLGQRSPRLFHFIIRYGGGFVILQLLNALITSTILNTLVLLGYAGVSGIVIWIIVRSVRDKTPGAFIFMIGSSVFFLSSALVAIAPFLGSLRANVWLDYTTIIGQMINALIFAAAIVRQTQVLKQERDASIQSELTLSREKLSLSQALLAANTSLETERTLSKANRDKLLSTQHDLRQPLKTFQFALENTTETNAATLAKLHAGLEYMHRVLEPRVDDIEPVAEADKPHKFDIGLSVETVPIQIVFDNLQRLYADEAAAKGLVLFFSPTSLEVQTNAIALIRILSNLVSNAIKYTKKGKILVGARLKVSSITIQVWDTGSGIEKTSQRNIFRRFKRGPATDAIEGQGLGLSIASNLAREQTLSLSINSRPGKGSVFAVTGLRRTGDI